MTRGGIIGNAARHIRRAATQTEVRVATMTSDIDPTPTGELAITVQILEGLGFVPDDDVVWERQCPDGRLLRATPSGHYTWYVAEETSDPRHLRALDARRES